MRCPAPFNGSVETRHGFLPPAYVIHPVDPRSPDLAALPAAPLLTDVFGEEPGAAGVTLRVGWSPEHLYVRAELDDGEPTVVPELPPGDWRFWKQDHIEVRLFDEAVSSFQLLAVDEGRYLDSADDWKGDRRIAVRSVEAASGQVMEMVVPVGLTGLGRLEAGREIRALVARVKWDAGRPTISTSSPATLGFGQVERAGRFVLADAAPVAMDAIELQTPWRAGPCAATITLHSTLSGRATVRIDGDADGEAAACVAERQIDLSPGQCRVEVDLPLRRPGYTRFGVRVVMDDREHALGSATVRAAGETSVIDAAASRGGHLFFGEEGLAQVRAALARPPLDVLWPLLQDSAERAEPGEIPPVSFHLDASSGQWWRVSRESMVRDGEGRRRPPCAYIWSRLSPEVQQAMREVAAQGEADAAQQGLIVDAFNTLLGQRDFYEADAFEQVTLNDRTRAAIAAGLDHLPPDELVRINRALLVAAIECIGTPARQQLAQLTRLRDAWIVAPDERIPAQATRVVAQLADTFSVIPQFDLHEGNASVTLAMAYELFGDALSEQQRGIWHETLRELLRLYLDSARQRRWQTTAIPNANPVCNGAGGILGMLLLRAVPDEAKEAIALARKLIWTWVDYCNGPEGGNTEGAQYWQYGTDAFLHFAWAMRNRLGDDDGLLDQPSIRKHMNMVRLGLCNDGCMHGVNDTIPMPVGGSIAWVQASLFGDDFALWYGDHALRTLMQLQQAGRKVAYTPQPLWSALTRPDAPEATEAPAFPQRFAMHDIEYGTLRSEPRWDAPIVAGLKGSRPPYTHHNQPDTGSFFVDIRGQRLLIDPGYYKSNPEFHGLPIIAGVAPQQPGDYVGRLEPGGDDATAMLTVDATPAYRGAAELVRRTLVLVGRSLIVIDDIHPAGLDVESMLQFGGPTELDGARTVRARYRDAAMTVQVLGGMDADIELMPRRSLDDTHWGYAFADCQWHPAIARYRTHPDSPLVMVISDTSEAAPPRARCTVESDAATVELDDEVAVTLTRSVASGPWLVRPIVERQA